jgi:DNA (cytosine-5)-methyltransferase 1
MKKRIFELFAGVGGLSYGFSKLPGFEIVLANEIESDIAKAYSLNHPEVKMLNMNISDITEETLLSKLGDKGIDLVVGGPPCQSYSTLGKRQMDERANLFMQYIRILKVLKPKAFVYENVTGLLSMEGGNLFKRILREFSDLGYDVKHEVLNAVNFGVPQIRERVILVGFLGENIFEYPKITHSIDGNLSLFSDLKSAVTLEDAIGDLPRIKSGERGYEYNLSIKNEFLDFVRDSDQLTEHYAPKNGKNLQLIMEMLLDGQGKDDLPLNIRPTSGFGNTYAKLWWKRPSTTITRNFSTPSSSRCIHPIDSRALTIREGARLQSFPDSYKFYGSESMKRLEIGNAVPPLLSLAIAKQVIKLFEGNT